MPRPLGSFKLAHAGFVEVFERESGGQDMYITTFNPALPFFHDGVYFLGEPGNSLDDVSNWASSLVQLGGASTAYWPNYPVQVVISVPITGIFKVFSSPASKQCSGIRGSGSNFWVPRSWQDCWQA